jgi:hypothetical protein
MRCLVRLARSMSTPASAYVMVRVSVVCCAKSWDPVQRAHRRRFSRGNRHCIIPRFVWAVIGVCGAEEEGGKAVKPQHWERRRRPTAHFTAEDTIPDPFSRKAQYGKFCGPQHDFLWQVAPGAIRQGLNWNLIL